jgi:hypothetical protein
MKEQLLELLQPICERIAKLDAAEADAARAELERALPASSLAEVRKLVRSGVEARWLCDRENAGVRFSRLAKTTPSGLSIDAVHMSGPGGAHTHPNGEFDLCFAVSGAPRFDGRSEGWTVYAPGSWHVPTVSGGAMDILYFLPGGAIVFGDRPK